MLTNAQTWLHWAAAVSVVCILFRFPGTAFAQCDPPGANTACWDGEGDGVSWSDVDNWDPDGLPGGSDDVYHLIGGTIELDTGTPVSPVVINSFTMLGESSGALAIDDGKGLSVGGDFIPDAGLTTGVLYDLTVGSEALLEIDGDLAGADVVLVAGSYGDETYVSVSGTIGAGNWVVNLDSEVYAPEIDLSTASSSAKDWTIEGFVHVQGDVLGAGTWSVDGSGEGATGVLWIIDGDFEVDDLSLVDKGECILDGEGSSSFTLNESLAIDDSFLDAEFYHIVADEGSVIDLDNGGGLFLLYAGQGSSVGSIHYGQDGLLPNFAAFTEELSFRYADSALSPTAGSSSALDLKVTGDLWISSRIHGDASAWDASGVDLTLIMDDLDTRWVENISPDFDGIWFADDAYGCVKPWGLLEIECYAAAACEDTILVDVSENSDSDVYDELGNGESMYVDGNVTLDSDARLDLNGRNLYYTGSLTPSCPSSSYVDGCPNFVVKTLFGDWNGDCTISAAEVLDLLQAIAETDPYDPLFDFDCDGTLSNGVEKAQVLENIEKDPSEFPCYEEESAEGGMQEAAGLGEEQLEWLSESLLDMMMTQQAGAFIEAAYTNAENYPENMVYAEWAVVADYMSEAF